MLAMVDEVCYEVNMPSVEPDKWAAQCHDKKQTRKCQENKRG